MFKAGRKQNIFSRFNGKGVFVFCNVEDAFFTYSRSNTGKTRLTWVSPFEHSFSRSDKDRERRNCELEKGHIFGPPFKSDFCKKFRFSPFYYKKMEVHF